MRLYHQMEHWNDIYYIRRIRQGDTECFGCLLDRYSHSVFSLIVRLTGNKEDAEELTQDVFLKVFQQLGRFREESSFSTWVYRIAYNTAISALRKQKKEFATDGEAGCFNISEEEVDTLFGRYDREEELQLLDRALEKLAPDEHFMILLYYKEGKRIEEIGEITALSPSNVKVKLFRIRKKLYEFIKRMEDNL